MLELNQQLHINTVAERFGVRKASMTPAVACSVPQNDADITEMQSTPYREAVGVFILGINNDMPRHFRSRSHGGNFLR